MGNGQGRGRLVNLSEEVVEGAEDKQKESSSSSSSVEKLRDASARICWLDMSHIANLPAPRNSQACCSHGSMMYVYGGRSQSGRLNDLWSFDCESGSWMEMVANDSADAPEIRSGCLLVHDGEHHLYLGFGFDRNPVAHNEMFRFDLIDCKWEGPLRVKGPTPPARINFRSWFCNDAVWLFGGSPDGNICLGDLWKLDLASMTWVCPATRGTPPPACQWVTAEILPNSSKVVLFGGHKEDGTPCNVFHLFDCEELEWTCLMDETPKFTPDCKEELSEEESELGWGVVLCSSPACAVMDDNMLIWGGWTGHEHRDSFWSCNLKTLQWRKIRPSELLAKGPQAKGSTSAMVWEGKMFFFGGWNGWMQKNDMACVSFAVPSLQRMCIEVLARKGEDVSQYLQLL